MIDPWKFNPLTDLGNKASKLSETAYIKEISMMTKEIVSKVKTTRKEVESGGKKLIDNSNELFL